MAMYSPGEPIRRDHLTSSAMVAGNEAHIEIVRMGGRVQEWVGIGWIDVTDLVPAADLADIPQVEA